MVKLIIVDIKDIVDVCDQLLSKIVLQRKIQTKFLIEQLLHHGNNQDFDVTFWDYVESLLTPQELEDDNIDKTAKQLIRVVETIVGLIDRKITEVTGVNDFNDGSFVNWYGSAVCIQRKDLY
jgi:hypothetical protein